LSFSILSIFLAYYLEKKVDDFKKQSILRINEGEWDDSDNILVKNPDHIL